MSQIEKLEEVLSNLTEVKNVYDQTLTIEHDGNTIKFDFDDSGCLDNIRVE